MSYQVLARKWRPRNFSELMGQTHVVRALSNALEQNRLHHAWLFTGTRGVGKTTIARILAKSLNCETGITAHPCGTCTACREIDAGRFVDLIELDAASNTGIDNMREVLDNAHYAPTAGRFKVYIIDEVHMLSRSAFNSMLKTLEEPPEHVKFILATTDPQKIPVTVLSRCLQFNLKQMTPSQVAEHLQHVLTEERIACEPAALNRIGHAARGSMRDALSLLDQAIAHSAGEIRDAAVQEMLGGLDRAALCGLLESIADDNGAELLARSASMTERSMDCAAALQELALVLHQIAILQTLPDALPEDTPDLDRLSGLAGRMSAEMAQLCYQICLLGRRDLPLAPDETAGFNMTLLRMLAFRPDAHPAGENAPHPPAPSRLAQPRPASAHPHQTAQSKPETPPGQLHQPHASEPGHAVAAGQPASASAPATGAITATAGSLPTDARQWAELLQRLRLGGQARMLAAECELVACEGSTICMRLANTHRHLAEPGYQSRLREALEKHFGLNIRLEIELADGATNSPQRLQTEARERLQATAEQTVASDPLVQDIIQQMGGRLTRVTPADTQTDKESS